jgi:hypothetical protein
MRGDIGDDLVDVPTICDPDDMDSRSPIRVVDIYKDEDGDDMLAFCWLFSADDIEGISGSALQARGHRDFVRDHEVAEGSMVYTTMVSFVNGVACVARTEEAVSRVEGALLL